MDVIATSLSSSAEHNVGFEFKSDCRYKQARKFLNEGNHEGAIELLAALLQSSNEEFGDLSLQSAGIYFEYGNALLLKEEESPSNGLLGGDEGGDDNDEASDGDNGDSDDEQRNGGDGNDNEEPDGDLQIAWEVLDVARCVWEKSLGINNECETSSATTASTTSDSGHHRELQLSLSDAYTRLGDLMRFNSNMREAIVEYSKALKLREAVCSSLSDSLLSEVHFSLAVTYVYFASEVKKSQQNAEDATETTVEGDSAIACKQRARTHYEAAKQSIELWLSEHSPTGANASDVDKAQQVIDKRELVDTLQETIDALILEIQQDIEDEAQCLKSTREGQLVATGSSTTVGFGNQAGKCSGSSSAAAPVIVAVGPTLLQVKKKPKKRGIEEVEMSVPASSSGNSTANCTSITSETVSAKRPAVDSNDAASSTAIKGTDQKENELQPASAT